jgi:N-acetylglucosamine-6-sulfatase
MTDNHPVGTEKDFMPKTWKRIYEQGVQFPNSFATTPLCCPSRASILTGMYAHDHGVKVNQDPLRKTTFIERLRTAGYATGQVGKYLNSWDGSRRSEFDFWVAIRFGGSAYKDPTLNIDGEWRQQRGYITHILRDHAVRFLNERAPRDKPFVLHLAFTAPHDEPTSRPGQFGPAVPAAGDEDLYRGTTAYRPPSYNERDISDKPNWLQRFRSTPIGPPVQAAMDDRRLKQLQTLKPVDDAVAVILDTLEAQRRLDDTVIFFLTDNGYLWGEHRLFGTGLPYTNGARIDLALRYPALVPSPRTEPRLVANVDIAPTIYQLAGIDIPPEVDGLSLVPLLDGTGRWREELLLEVWPDPVLQMPFPPSAAVRTERYVYAETEGDRPELYDLRSDPHQLENRAGDPALASVQADLRARLQRLRTQ